MEKNNSGNMGDFSTVNIMETGHESFQINEHYPVI
jgi:hypothetical protein